MTSRFYLLAVVSALSCASPKPDPIVSEVQAASSVPERTVKSAVLGDPCPEGRVLYDGKCHGLYQVKAEIDEAGEKAVKAMAGARSPLEQVEAQQQVTETQVDEMGVLDVELEQIKEKLKEAKESRKGYFSPASKAKRDAASKDSF